MPTQTFGQLLALTTTAQRDSTLLLGEASHITALHAVMAPVLREMHYCVPAYKCSHAFADLCLAQHV